MIIILTQCFPPKIGGIENLIEKIKECKVVDKNFNYRIDDLIKNITNMEFETNNLLSNNLQCIIIDFGCCSRKLEK